MMHQVFSQFGEHQFAIRTDSVLLMNRFTHVFHSGKTRPEQPIDWSVHIHNDSVTPFVTSNSITSDRLSKSYFDTESFHFTFHAEGRSADLFLTDPTALHQAFLTLYGTFIMQQGWGLLVRASTESDKAGDAHLCMGSPKAKSDLLPIKLTMDGLEVFQWSSFGEQRHLLASGTPVASLNFIQPAFHNHRAKAARSVVLLRLLDHISYWPHAAAETSQVLALLRRLVHAVPVYECALRPGSLLGELIS